MCLCVSIGITRNLETERVLFLKFLVFIVCLFQDTDQTVHYITLANIYDN